MANHPLLVFPQPRGVERSRRSGGGGLRKPTAAEQRQRLDSRFRRVVNSLRSVQPDVQGLVPEQVIVLETIGTTVEGLAKAAGNIEGLEWLAEMDLDEVTPTAGFANVKDPTAPLSCRLYAMMSNERAMDELLAMWNRWTQAPEQKAERGYGPFKKLFSHLRDVRRWSAEDRITATGVVEYLEERLSADDEEVQFEVELWCRQEGRDRHEAYQRLARVVERAGGQCLRQFALPAIFYHGVLVSMQCPDAKSLIEQVRQQQYTELVRCEDVMFFRPRAQAAFPVQEAAERSRSLTARMQETPLPDGEPVLAILDGLPLEQHRALRGRLVVDDPDKYEERYDSSEQQHGTAMASLAIHGELHQNESPLASRVYCRPVLTPVRVLDRSEEQAPADELLVDLFHRAVRRIVDPTHGDAVAPAVRVINLSFGDPYRPFDRDMSPLARLLDWLAWKYRLLFLVSSGNQRNDVVFDMSLADFQSLDPEGRIAHTLESIHADQVARRNYSPSESLNAITVGAVHADASQPRQGDRRVDLLHGRRLPSPITTVCNGFRRSVKPDVLFPGGRQLYNDNYRGPTSGPATFEVSTNLAPPGQQVALPGTAPMQLDWTGFMRGTSNATALASRTAAQINERLDEIAATPEGAAIREADRAVLLKCLLAHGADWGTAGEALDEVFQEKAAELTGNDSRRTWRVLEDIKSRFLGFGEVTPERCLYCTDSRVTLVGWGALGKDEGHQFAYPLPEALSGHHVRRRLTVTLAWITPVNFRSQKYRRAQLWLGVDGTDIGTGKHGLSAPAAQRGTVEHRVLEGTKTAPIVADDVLQIKVSCREDAGGLSEEVPYAMAATLEVAEPLEVSIYEQIRQRVRTRIRVDASRSGT